MNEAQFIVEDVEATLVQWQTPGAPTYIKTVTLSRCGLTGNESFPTPMLMQLKIVGPSLDQFKKSKIVLVSLSEDRLTLA